jgi:hypothetical protein
MVNFWIDEPLVNVYFCSGSTVGFCFALKIIKDFLEGLYEHAPQARDAGDRRPCSNGD